MGLRRFPIQLVPGYFEDVARKSFIIATILSVKKIAHHENDVKGKICLCHHLR